MLGINLTDYTGIRSNVLMVTLYSHVLGLGVVLAALPVGGIHGVGVSLGGVLRPGVVSGARTRPRPSVRAQ